MKVLIVEDEPLAAKLLANLIHQYESHIEIVGQLDTITGVINWLKTNQQPDLIFLDIQLADGISFEIFEHIEIESPIIFTTAYDEYALRAFKVNSVDYLLKPLTFEPLATALDKYNRIYGGQVEKSKPIDQTLIQQLMASMKPENNYKDRFIVKKGEHLLSISICDILYFYAEDKITLFKNREGKRYMINYTLGELETLINPQTFFRLNRRYLACHDAIADIISYSHSRLRIVLKYSDDRDILVSKQRVGDFKEWLGA